MDTEQLRVHIMAIMPQEFKAEWQDTKDCMTMSVTSDSIVQVLKLLRDDPKCQFKMLIDVCGVDFPERTQRFEVVYNLLSVANNKRLRVKVAVADGVSVSSVSSVYSTAGWLEREVWDMYGVLFSDHPDLRRILTDYGFEGHPLRKDFPLSGHVEVRYRSDQQRVVYEPIKLDQEFRQFDFMSPWEGTQYVIPDNDKQKSQ